MNKPAADNKSKRIKTCFTVLLFILLLFCAVFLLKAWKDGHFTSAQGFQEYVSSFGAWAPLILTLIQALQVVIPVLPGFLGCFVGAALFGRWGGFRCTARQGGREIQMGYQVENGKATMYVPKIAGHYML